MMLYLNEVEKKHMAPLRQKIRKIGQANTYKIVYLGKFTFVSVNDGNSQLAGKKKNWKNSLHKLSFAYKARNMHPLHWVWSRIETSHR